MKISTTRIFLLPVIGLLCGLPAFTQAMPENFFYDKRGQMVYQVGPIIESALASAKSDGEFTAVAISAGLTEKRYYISLVNIRPERSGQIFAGIRKLPLTITMDGEEVIVNNDRYHRERKEKKLRTEILVFGISEGLFNEILSARKVLLEVGKFDHLLSTENLQAFRHLRAKLEKEADERESETVIPAERLIPLRGFYHWDGYFVKWVNRKDT